MIQSFARKFYCLIIDHDFLDNVLIVVSSRKIKKQRIVERPKTKAMGRSPGLVVMGGDSLW